MTQGIDPKHVSDARATHPMGPSIILVTAVVVLIVILAVASSLP